MKTLFTSVLLVYSIFTQTAHAQQLLTIMRSSTATPSNYDDLMARLEAKGLDKLDWTFHAIGAGQAGGLFSIGLFPNQAALDDRMEKVRPVFQEAGVNAPAPQVFEVYRTFTGRIPAAKPANGIVVFFDAHLTPAQYDQIVDGLAKAGLPVSPDGHLFHAAIRTPDGIKVVDVWESPEKFQAFGNTLIPIIQSIDPTPIQPVIYHLYNYIIP